MTAATTDICDVCGRDVYEADEENTPYYGWYVCGGCGLPAYPINSCTCTPVANEE